MCIVGVSGVYSSLGCSSMLPLTELHMYHQVSQAVLFPVGYGARTSFCNAHQGLDLLNE